VEGTDPSVGEHGLEMRSRRPWLPMLAFLALTLGVRPAHAQPRGVLLASSTGPASVRRSGMATYAAATRHMSLAAGDILRTGAGGGAILLFPDGSEIKVGPSSALLIPAIAAN